MTPLEALRRQILADERTLCWLEAEAAAMRLKEADVLKVCSDCAVHWDDARSTGESPGVATRNLERVVALLRGFR